MLVSADVLRGLGAVVETISLEEWQDPARRFATAWKAKQFAAHAVLSLPNAGYALQFMDSSEDQANNLFTDILSIPTILPWDHLLTQAPAYFLADCLSAPPDKKGALSQIAARLAKPMTHHYLFDSGHLEVYHNLGLVIADKIRNCSDYANQHFVQYGSATTGASVRGRVGFSGNIYSRIVGVGGYHQTIAELIERIVQGKCKNWSLSGWQLLSERLNELTTDDRENLGLTVDHPFFWRCAYELLSSRLLTDFRLSVLSSIKRPIDFYGNFVDASASEALAQFDNISYRGSLDFTDSLPTAYSSYEIWVDVANTSFINGCGSKVLNCFAAGSLMLIDHRVDLLHELGDLGERFMYRNAEELNQKIAYFLARPAERLEIVEAMQSIIRERLNFASFAERACVEAAPLR